MNSYLALAFIWGMLTHKLNPLIGLAFTLLATIEAYAANQSMEEVKKGENARAIALMTASAMLILLIVVAILA